MHIRASRRILEASRRILEATALPPTTAAIWVLERQFSLFVLLPRFQRHMHGHIHTAAHGMVKVVIN
eukprot:scaffold111635_cov36-Tisochrysis_lutea.AAC.3